MNNISSLDLNLLKALDALLDELNVTRAAMKLSLTQPAVSSMLNRLRINFNDPLFTRAPHGLIPTDKALTLAQPVKHILLSISQLLTPVDFNPCYLQTTFRIAASDHDMQTIGMPFILELKQQAPYVKVAFLSFHQLNLHSMLENSEIDLIIASPSSLSNSMHSKILYEERYVCILRKEHPALKNNRITLDNFCQLEHVLISCSGGKFSGATDKALAKIGRKRNVSLSVTSFLLLPSIIEQSDFISVVPERLTRQLKNLIVVEPPVKIKGYTKIMAWHQRTHNNPVQQWLRQLIHSSIDNH